MEQPFDRSRFFIRLNSICKKIDEDKKKVSKNDSDLKEIYNEIRKMLAYPVNVQATFHEDEKTLISAVLQSLLEVINKSDCCINDLLLGGTCIATFLYKTMGPECTALYSTELMVFFGNVQNNLKNTHLDESCPQRKTSLDEKLKHLSQNRFCCSSYNQVYEVKNFEAVHAVAPLFAILHGILSCHKIDLLTFKFRYKCVETPFFVLIFDLIVKLCAHTGELYFHAFQLLLNWMRVAIQVTCSSQITHKCVERKVTKVSYFHSGSYIVKNILTILEANWECPISGVPECVRNIYKSLFEAHIKESQTTDVTDYLISFLLEKTMKLSWKIKGKYIVLASLLYHIDLEVFFHSYPDAPAHMMSSIKANYIASILSEVYKTIILRMKECSETTYQKWKCWWLEPILNALASNDKHLFQNVKNYILPVTLKEMPNSYFILVEVLKRKKINDMAEVVLLRIAKENDVYKYKPQELYNELQNKLHHGSECVRIEVLTTLCSSTKKSEPVSTRTLEFIKEFLVVNLNVDSSAFNQSLMTQLKALLIRIRDSLARFAKKFEKVDLKQIEFVEWVTQTALNNTFPGACYQRRRTCLQILNLIFDTFLIAPRVKRRKEQPSANINRFILLAQERGYWMFFKDSTLFRIFPCLSDFTDDIRSMGADLLQSFFSWPSIDDVNGSFHINIPSLLDNCLSLCSCSHLRFTDSGSLICCILFSQYVLNQGRKARRQTTSFSSQSFDCYEACMDFLLYLTEIAELQLSKAQEDFLTAASMGPVYGMLHAIQRCISEKEILIAAVKNYKFEVVENLVRRILDLCSKTVSYMLSLMGSNENSELAPSFEDIGRSLQEHLVCRKCKIDEVGKVGPEMELNSCALSPEFQLLLSCCWHSIKNSCFLVNELVVPVLNLDTSVENIKSFLLDISIMLSSALLRCRHRGVIEACSTALNKFCRHLLSSKLDVNDIPFQLLKNSLEALTDSALTSVTRRSAGLSLLIQAIVASEADMQKGTFLSFSIKKLLSIINQPLCGPSDQTRDLPQVSAYHVLKTLISDACLSSKIFPWLEEIFPICISGFSSASWAVRNAALQLFGAVLPRMCGQKKIRDDESEHNLISPAELFMRCRNLYPLLFEHFQNSIYHHSAKQLHPELVPLLCLVAKLSPEENNDVNKKYVEDFKPLLVVLLKSRLWHVRNMASSALSAIFHANDSSLTELSVLINLILASSDRNVNEINGILLTVRKILFSNNESIENWNSIIDVVVFHSTFVIKAVSLCDINSSLFLDVLWKLATFHASRNKFDSLIITIKSQLLDAKFERSRWNYQYLLNVLQWCNSSESMNLICDVLFYNQDCTKACLDFLYKFLENAIDLKSDVQVDASYWKEILKFIVTSLENITEPIILCDILNFIISLCSKLELVMQILDLELACALEHSVWKLHRGVNGLSISASTLTVASFCIRSFLHNQNYSQSWNSRLEFWINTFFDFSHPRKPEILKTQAAYFISVAGNSIIEILSTQLSQESDFAVNNLICICDGSLMLLEDEDAEVRYLTSVFTSSLPHQYKVQTIHHSTGVMVLCNFMINLLASSDIFIKHLWNQLQTFPSTAKMLHILKLKNRKMNLFEQEYVNVYAEPVTLTFIHFAQLKIVFHQLQKTNSTLWLEKLKMFVDDVEHEIIDASTILTLYKKEISDVLFMEYVSQPAVYLTLFKLNCAAKVICEQIELDALPITLKKTVTWIEKSLEELKKSISLLASWVSYDWHFSSNFNIISLLGMNSVCKEAYS